MKPYCLSIAIFFLFVFNACNNDQPTEATAEQPAATASAPADTFSCPNITVDQFRERMHEAETVLLDVRTPEEIAAGKIENALELNVNDENFAEQLNQLPKDKTYLVYCRSGRRSARACGIMAGQGFTDVYNLEGGYLAWTKEK